MAKKTAAPSVTPPAPAADYTVVARRYRPQVFEDLIGQEAIAQALKNAILGQRVAHAYLFTGARGVGKTSTARILAKALNCVNGPTVTPCGQCEACRAIAVGDDVDVLEIDGASNRNLDDVRELRQNVQYRPTRSRYKIYIIDEVHMLTREAFNALLKTLEEPPGHVKFIFATTDVQRVPITILSRCQRFDFGGIGAASIKAQLQRVVNQENAEAEDDALMLLARRAGGSLRDAQSLLDQALAFSSGKITVAQVQELLGTASDDQVQAMVAAALQRDSARVLDLVQEVAAKGVSLSELLDQLIMRWRQLMLLKTVGVDSPLLEDADAAKQELARQAEGVSLDAVFAGLEILLAAKSRLRTTGHGAIVVEMALIRLSQVSDLLPLAVLARQMNQLASGAPSTSLRQGGAEGAPRRPRAAEAARAGGEGAASAAPFSPAATPPAPPTPPAPDRTGPLSAAALPDIWAEVLDKAGPMLKGNLEKATKRHFTPGSELRPATITLGFPRNYESDWKSCQTRVTRIEELFKKAAGQQLNIRLELLPGPVPATQPEAAPVLKPLEQRKAAMQEPLVRQAVEHLGAMLLRHDEGFGTKEVPPN